MMTRRARAKTLRALLGFGLAAALCVALPLAPYLLREHEGTARSVADQGGHSHAHTDSAHTDSTDTTTDSTTDPHHLHCLKCVLAASSPPQAVTAQAVAEARVAGVFVYEAPPLERPFDPNAGARAPPSRT